MSYKKLKESIRTLQDNFKNKFQVFLIFRYFLLRKNFYFLIQKAQNKVCLILEFNNLNLEKILIKSIK